MAFNSNAPRAEYTATTSQTVFPFLFKIFSDTDLVVYKTPSGQNPDDTADLLTLTTDYTVDINGDSGGEITLLSGTSNGDLLTLVRSLEVTRNIEYQTSGDLLAETLNEDQEYQTYLIADNKGLGDRYIRLSENAQSVDNTLPSPSGGEYLTWNSDGTAIENTTAIPGSATGETTSLDTTNFDNNLSGTDNTVQKAMETLDDAVSGGISASDNISFTGDNSFSQPIELITPSGSLTLEAEDGVGASTVVIPKAGGFGKVLQVVSATLNTSISTTSTIAIDLTGLSVNITPSKPSSKILIIYDLHVGNSAINTNLSFIIKRDATTIGIGSNGSINITSTARIKDAEEIIPTSSNYLDSPNTTSQITYKIQGYTSSGTMYINRRNSDSYRPISTITLMEIGT